MTANDATLRRIAIVLASLPQAASQKLLGSLQADVRNQVRQSLQQLSDVDPLERRRALDGFARSLKQSPGGRPNDSEAAEVVFSRAAMQSRGLSDSGAMDRGSAGSPPSDYNPQSPFAFLQQVDDHQLLAQLLSERPQTLAILLASIPPSHAARLLPRFDLRVRTEAMRRIAKLKEIPADLVEEIASHLRSSLQQSTGGFAAAGASEQGNDPGQRALNAILARMSDEPTGQVAMSRITPGRTESNPASTQVQPLANIRMDSTGMNPSLASNTVAATTRNTAMNRLDSPEAAPSDRQNADEVDRYLAKLKPEQLRDALGSVDTQTAMLALCGLPRSAADSVLSLLPRKQAKQVRQQLTELVTMELRQIDEAKETVARMARRATLPPSKSRPQAIAA